MQCDGDLSKTHGSGLTSIKKKYGILVMCFVNDVVIATPTLNDYIDKIDEISDSMKRADLKCKPSKCRILRDSIKYKGIIMDKHGVRPNRDAKRPC